MTGQEIANAVNKIIEEIPRQKRLKMGAINWGNLRCRRVTKMEEIWPDTESAIEREILIEEADPSNYEFAQYVYNRLVLEYGISANIRTEW